MGRGAAGKYVFACANLPSKTKKMMHLLISSRALVFITHGFGEHCSRYERLGTALAEQGYFAFSQDHGMYYTCPTSKQRNTCFQGPSALTAENDWG